MREILFVAGEASGDLHASAVARAIRTRDAHLALVGIGGEGMRAAGVELLEDTDRLAVMGFIEVLRHVPHHWALLRSLKQRIRGGRVAAVVLVDYPGFNMKVAEAAHAAGVPVLYYITPQVWAWGAGRMAKLARWVTKAAVILPFEEALLRKHGVDATFVGHPLLDYSGAMLDRAASRVALGLPADARVLALFPGSRTQEILRHLDDFVRVAHELQRRDPELRVVVSVAPTVQIDPTRCPFPMVRSSSFTVFGAADAAMCKSGTTTLEAAVAGCPLVVAYRTSAVTFALARHLVTIPHIGLVNVVAGREVAPEFVQTALKPNAVADALEPLLRVGSSERQKMLADLAGVRAALGVPGASGRVADMTLALAQRSIVR